MAQWPPPPKYASVFAVVCSMLSIHNVLKKIQHLNSINRVNTKVSLFCTLKQKIEYFLLQKPYIICIISLLVLRNASADFGVKKVHTYH